MIELEEPLTNCGCPYCDEARENKEYEDSQFTRTTEEKK